MRTVGSWDLSHRIANVMDEVAAGRVIRIIDARRNKIRGYITLNAPAEAPPADVLPEVIPNA